MDLTNTAKTNSKFFKIYQFLVPAVIFPLSYYLWLSLYGHDHHRVLIIIFLPVILGYVIPGLGTNKFKIWEINTKLRLGKFRPHHGFVIGSGINIAAWICYFPSAGETLVWDACRYSLALGSFFGFWSWLYDYYAVKSGFILIYTKEAFQKQGPAEITLAYAPAFFGGAGFTFGLCIKIFEWAQIYSFSWPAEIGLWIFSTVLMLTLPMLTLAFFKYLKGEPLDFKSYKDEMNL